MRRVVVCLSLCIPLNAQPAERSLLNTAVEHQKRGEYQQASDILQTVLHERKQLYGADDLRTLEVMHYMGQLANQSGQPEQAMKLLRPVMEGFKRALGPDDVNTYTAQAALGIAHREAREYRTAIRLLESAAEYAAKEPARDPVRRAHILGELATAYAMSDKGRDALIAIHQAASILGTTPLSSQLLLQMGQIEAIAGKNDSALRHLESARELAARVSPTHPDLGAIHASLGLIYKRMGRYTEAERELRAAAEICIRTVGEDHHEVGVILDELAIVLKKQKRRDEAKSIGTRARAILSNSPRAPHTVSVWALRDGH